MGGGGVVTTTSSRLNDVRHLLKAATLSIEREVARIRPSGEVEDAEELYRILAHVSTNLAIARQNINYIFDYQIDRLGARSSGGNQ